MVDQAIPNDGHIGNRHQAPGIAGNGHIGKADAFHLPRRAGDRNLFAHKLDAGCKVLHDWTPGGEAWAVVVKVADYSKRRETMSKLSVALTEELQREGFPLGVVTFYKET